MAASILSLGHQAYQLNFAARFVGHMSLALLSLLGAVSLTKGFRSLGELFMSPLKDNFYFRGFILRTFRVILAVGFAFGLPVFNMLLIANGLHETPAIRLLWADSFGTKERYIYLLAKHGKTIEYEPWDGISYPMAATIVITIAHILIILWDAAIVGDKKPVPRSTPGTPPVPGTTPAGTTPTGSPRGSAGVYEDTLNTILEFYGLDENQRVAKVAMAINNTARLSDPLKLELANVVYQLVERVTKHATGGTAAERTALLKDIDALFRASSSNGKGFGMGLPRPKNP